jgi:hypothetical protein
MTEVELSALLIELLSLPHETEWVEWKHNNDHPEMIGECLSAFAAITTMQPGFTKATLFAHQKLTNMDSVARIRACYQHACLCYVTNRRMTNATLRERFGIKPESASQASRLIREALKADVIKLYDPDVRDRDRSYVPFWA